jgi:hypothetical protein
MDRVLRRDTDPDWLRAELALVVEIDGAAATRAQIDALLADAEAGRAVISARAQLYTWLVEQGRIRAICPVCSEAKELDLGFYVLAMRMRPWAVLDGLLLATPKLATPNPPEVRDVHGERPVAMRGLAPRPASPAKAARIEFALPSARCRFDEEDDPVGGAMGDIEVEREAAAWRTYGGIGGPQPVERVHWEYDEAWFRAALRLMVATTELHDRDGKPRPLVPETFTWMWLADIQFLDAVYTATHDLAVEDVEACTVRCSAGHPFLPVR